VSDTRYRSPPDYEESNKPPYEPAVNLEDKTKSRRVLKYYMDADKNEAAPTDSQGNLLLDFGTVLQGSEKKIRLHVTNTIEYPIQLEPIIENGEPDLKITRFPPIIQPAEIAPVDIVFSPDVDRVKPLEAGFDFRKIILTRT
jgi:hypothetical protein